MAFQLLGLSFLSFQVQIPTRFSGICILYSGLLDYFDTVGLLKLVDRLFKYGFD